MTPVAWTILIVGIIAVVGILFLFTARTKKLKSQFGPEYDRQVKASGNNIARKECIAFRFILYPNRSANNSPESGVALRKNL